MHKGEGKKKPNCLDDNDSDPKEEKVKHTGRQQDCAENKSIKDMQGTREAEQ